MQIFKKSQPSLLENWGQRLSQELLLNPQVPPMRTNDIIISRVYTLQFSQSRCLLDYDRLILQISLNLLWVQISFHVKFKVQDIPISAAPTFSFL